MFRPAGALASLVLMATACNEAGSSPRASTSEQASATPRVTATVEASTAPAGASPSVTITGFGATSAAWNSAHRIDDRFTPGSAFDPIPGLGPDEQHDAKYFAVTLTGDRVYAYSERLPNGSSFADVRVAALAELPADGKVLWSATRDTCAQMELQSASLGSVLASSGMVFVEVVTETAAGGSGYDPKNANELLFMLGDYKTKADAPAC